MHRVEGVVQLLHVIALANIAGVIALAIPAHEEMIVGQLRRLPRAHVSPNHTAQFTHGISFERNFIFEAATCGLARLFDAAPVYVIHPTMITAANSTRFNPTVIKGRAAVRAVRMDQADATELVAKEQQIFAEPAHKFWHLGSDLIGKANRQPILSQRCTRGSPRSYAC